MIDKQEIIINGVDVSEYTLKEIEYKLSHTTKNKIIESCLEIVKQLQRANYQIAEAENLQCDMREKIDELSELLKCKTAECEELKAKLKEKDSELSKKCFELLEKKARIAQLIDENATKEVIYKINGKCAKTTANRVKEITAIVNNKAIIYEQQDQYKQALEEIEKFLEHFCSKKCPNSINDYCEIADDCPLDEIVNPILDIISKVKG